MQRDMDLVREILKELAESSQPLPASVFACDGRDVAEVGYNMVIMDEAGLIKASRLGADGDPYYRVTALRMTWAGNDFLASVKSDATWGKVKRRIAKSTGDAAFEVFVKLAAQIGAAACGVG